MHLRLDQSYIYSAELFTLLNNTHSSHYSCAAADIKQTGAKAWVTLYYTRIVVATDSTLFKFTILNSAGQKPSL